MMYAAAVSRNRFTRICRFCESVTVRRATPSTEMWARDSAATKIWTGRTTRRWWCARNSTVAICATCSGAGGLAPAWVSVSSRSSTGSRGRTAGCSPGRKSADRCATIAVGQLPNSRSSIRSTGCDRSTGTWCGIPGWTPCTKSSCRSCPATGRSTCRAPREVSGCAACLWTGSPRYRTTPPGCRWTSGPSCLPGTNCARTSWPSNRTRTPVFLSLYNRIALEVDLCLKVQHFLHC